MHVRKGDQVVVVSGREKGKRGRVLRLLTAKNRVLIQRSPRGGIVEKEAGLPASNVSLWCGKCAAPRRAKHEMDGDKKRRACVKCGTAFESA